MRRRILLIGTFDTKGAEFAFVREAIEKRGHSVVLMDAGVMGEPPFKPDISASEVAAAAGSDLESLRNTADRSHAMDVMIAGVRRLATRMYAEGKFEGILSLGGGGGTNIATAAMRELPVGVPKIMVSTLASSDVSSFVDIRDITMMYSVVDIAGLNRLSRRIFLNAAGAISGMVEQRMPAVTDKPMIAASMFGVTTPCMTRVRERLEESGFEVLVFHSTGTGGRAMESLISEGYFTAAADVTTTEWADQVVGGVLSSGPDRLGAAGRAGIPQVVSCGALDLVNFHGVTTVPDRFKTRKLYKHNPTVTLMRTSAAECSEIGRCIAKKLNKATGPTVLMLPLKGISMIDQEGQPFYDPAADQALFDSFRKHIGPNVILEELDMHINDLSFADAIADRLAGLIASHQHDAGKSRTEMKQDNSKEK